MASIGPTQVISCIFVFILTTETNCCCPDAVYDFTAEMSLFVVTVGSYNAALAPDAACTNIIYKHGEGNLALHVKLFTD